MGRELTLRHASLFEKKLKNVFLFARDVYRYGKIRELVSFMVWELRHRLSLFPRNKYLQFGSSEPLLLDSTRLQDKAFREQMDRFSRSRGLSFNRSDHNWKLVFIAPNGDLYGCLSQEDRNLYRSEDNGKSLVLVEKFPKPIKSLFISSQDTIFVCIKGAVYKSSAQGGSFKKTLELGSSESFFRHNNAMTETPDKTLIIGEYGNVWDNTRWRKLAYLYFSSDNGETWETSDFLIKTGTNKHVHLVKYSTLFNKILMADGDNKKKLWSSNASKLAELSNPRNWKPVNRFHIQTGGYTSVVESNDRILFGTDYQGGTNFLVDTTDGKTFSKRIVPDPYRRSPIHNMVQRKSSQGTEIWAILPYSTAHTKCLLMYSKDCGKSWNKFLEYSRDTHQVWLISSSTKLATELYVSVEDVTNKERAVYRVSDAAI